jgi:lysozyme
MNRDRLAEILAHDEAKRDKPYDDATGREVRKGSVVIGKVSIGIGRNLTDKGLSDDEIAYLLGNDISEVERQLDRALPWWRFMSENRQLVLASMCFNMGLGDSTRGLLSFRNTLSAMEAGDYKRAADGIRNSAYAKQVKGRAERLADMMEHG